jgi:hypothetical protein
MGYLQSKLTVDLCVNVLVRPREDHDIANFHDGDLELGRVIRRKGAQA